MLPSHTVLAIGTSAGNLIVGAIGAVIGMAALTVSVLLYRHGQRVLHDTRTARAIDRLGDDLNDIDTTLRQTKDKLCEFAQVPCTTGDLASLRQLRTQISTPANAPEAMRTELREVVEGFTSYLSTGLTSLTNGDRRQQLERAMEQEHARMHLHTAIVKAQQKSRELRNG
ncbi:hypothetical protein [Streptomyces yangpuensis]|uniref:hypothetical protein n=1 Tax=Streptomyces yangpuensis TaxID=1648182 RepID=UPI0036666C2E